MHLPQRRIRSKVDSDYKSQLFLAPGSNFGESQHGTAVVSSLRERDARQLGGFSDLGELGPAIPGGKTEWSSSMVDFG